MKLRNSILSILVASTFFACSNDNDPIDIQERIPDATLTLMVNEGVKVAPKTKADPASAEILARDVISKLTVLIFEGGDNSTNSNKLVHQQSAELKDGESTITKIEGIPVVSGNMKVIVVANMFHKENILAPNSTLASFLTAAFSLGNEKDKNLTMSSRIFDVTAMPDTVNYLGGHTTKPADGILLGNVNEVGDGVKLYRTVSRVQLTGLTLKAKQGTGIVPTKFVVDSIFVANAKGYSYLATPKANGKVEVEAYDPNFWLHGGCLDSVGLLKPTPTTSNFPHKMLNLCTATNIEIEGTTSTKITAKEEALGRSFYVYENTVAATPTLLVVRGDLTYMINGVERTKENCYYPVQVNHGGVIKYDETITKHDYIRRNNSYNIDLTITGPGSDNPFTPEVSAFLSAQLMVQDWNVVNMNPDLD
ncbi:MAG: fimbrial protein [Tannerellaceae bacterium]